MMLPKHLPASARAAVPWKNGGGITREVARDVQSGSDGTFRWRVSIAEVSKEGPFSRFPGYRRIISVIRGQGMELREAGRGATVLQPFHPYAFDGDADVYGALPSGPVSDLNVIFQPRAVRASMHFTEQGGEFRAETDSTMLILNMDPRALECSAGGQYMFLAGWDAVLATSGMALSFPAGVRCAVITLVSRL